MLTAVPLDDDADIVSAQAALHDDEIAETMPPPNTIQPQPPQPQPQPPPATAVATAVVATAADTATTSPPSSVGGRSKFKVVFLGDASVGKTSIVTRFVYDQFDGAYKVTIGIDFVSKSVVVPESNGVVRLQLWDTAGQERFRSLIPSYIRDSHVAVVVFDVSSRTSYDSAFVWLSDVRAERGDDVVCYVVGNKCDVPRTVSAGEAAERCKQTAAEFMETSALTGHNITALFDDIAQRISQMSSRRANAYIGTGHTTDVVLTAQSATPPSSSWSLCGC